MNNLLGPIVLFDFYLQASGASGNYHRNALCARIVSLNRLSYPVELTFVSSAPAVPYFDQEFSLLEFLSLDGVLLRFVLANTHLIFYNNL